MKTRVLAIVFASISYLGNAQSWDIIKHVARPDIENLALDQIGNIYISDSQGSIAKFSARGQLMQEYAPVQRARVNEIVANSQLKVTLFYEDLQEVVILNRYLASPIRYRLNDFDLGYVEDISPSFQQTLWVVDISDFSLKLIDVRENRFLERKSLAQVLNQKKTEILSFHTHQNRMYLTDKSVGIQVFDNIGNYLFLLTEEAPEEIRFEKDYLYYSEDGMLKFVHLYEGENSTLPLPSNKFKKIGYSNGRLIAVTDQGFDIYQYLSAE